MIDFIPLEHYGRVYYTILAAFIGSFAIMLSRYPRAVVAHPGVKNNVVLLWGWACVVILVLLLGLRPISFSFGDMGNYYKQFRVYEYGGELGTSDVLFEAMMWAFARYMNAGSFFFACIVLYLLPLAVAFRRLLGQYWPLAFFLAAAHFDFYGYGVNGIRQGVASSLMLLALTSKGVRSWLLVGAAIGFHGSLVVPAIAYAMTLVFRKPRYYFYGWGICLLATSVYSGFGDLIFSSSFSDDRLDRYVDMDSGLLEQFSKVGFRFDFLAYGLLPILLGYYVVIVRGIRDESYVRLLQVYLTANAVWLLMIRTPISNRVAYLSWFLMGILIAYPLVRYKIFKDQHLVYVAILLVMFSYTLVRNI